MVVVEPKAEKKPKTKKITITTNNLSKAHETHDSFSSSCSQVVQVGVSGRSRSSVLINLQKARHQCLL